MPIVSGAGAGAGAGVVAATAASAPWAVAAVCHSLSHCLFGGHLPSPPPPPCWLVAGRTGNWSTRPSCEPNSRRLVCGMWHAAPTSATPRPAALRRRLFALCDPHFVGQWSNFCFQGYFGAGAATALTSDLPNATQLISLIFAGVQHKMKVNFRADKRRVI